jgi:hypothetical protein
VARAKLLLTDELIGGRSEVPDTHAN